MLKVDIIKQEEMKEEIQKSTPDEQESLSKPSRNLIEGINTSEIPHCKILETILKMEQKGT